MLRAVGRATVSDHAIIVVVGTSIAVGVYRCFEFVAIVLVTVTAMLDAAMRAAAGLSTVAAAVGAAVGTAAVTSVRGCNMRSAQTKHDCERENCNRFSDVHDLVLLVECVNGFSATRRSISHHRMIYNFLCRTLFYIITC
jgi:hypothetical protein